MKEAKVIVRLYVLMAAIGLESANQEEFTLKCTETNKLETSLRQRKEAFIY